MKTKLIHIGNSKGIIIPAKLLTLLGLKDNVKLKIENDHLQVLPIVTKPREGWEEVIKKEMKINVQSDKIIPDFFEDESLYDWIW